MRGQARSRQRRRLSSRWRLVEHAGLWVAVVTGGVLAALLTIQLLPDRVSLRPGQVAPEDIIAHRTVRYLDERETQRLRDEAAGEVARRYAVDPEAAIEAERKVGRFFDVARRARAGEGQSSARRPSPSSERARGPEAELPAALRGGPLRAAIRVPEAEAKRLARIAVSVVRQVMAQPIPSDTDELRRQRSRLPTLMAAFSLAGPEAALVGTVAGASLRSNRLYEVAATSEARRAARLTVEPYYRKINRGEVIIPRGERVRPEHLDRLMALGLRRPHIDIGTALCLTLIAYGLVALTGFYLYHFHRRVFRQRSSLLLLAIVTTAAILLFRLGASALGLKLSGTQLGYVGVIFAAMAAMLVSVLVQPQIGLFVGVLMSILTGLIVNNELRFTLIAIVSSVVGCVVVSNIRDRVGLLRAALYVSLANVVTSALVTGATSPDPMAELATGAAWGVIGGFLSAFLFALGATLLERPFGVTTHLTLLELSDPNKPLLKRLAMEAPGTYAHSIMVGNLAEAAAEAIGADALFARVASYYHDVGKVFRPQFFVENQQKGNRHDGMTPSLSRLVVTSHVKDGVELAEQYRLPPPIIDIIREHHGTCLIRYFYQQAMNNESEPLTPALEFQFRYDGPRPRSKESGIIMIADAAEAASRTLEKPSPGRVRDLVERIVRDRLSDGQLDNCELTFKDLERIIAALTRTLAGTLHARIDYPDVPAPSREVAAGARRAAAGTAATALESPTTAAPPPEDAPSPQSATRLGTMTPTTEDSHGGTGEESAGAAESPAALSSSHPPPRRDAARS